MTALAATSYPACPGVSIRTAMTAILATMISFTLSTIHVKTVPALEFRTIVWGAPAFQIVPHDCIPLNPMIFFLCRCRYNVSCIPLNPCLVNGECDDLSAARNPSKTQQVINLKRNHVLKPDAKATLQQDDAHIASCQTRPRATCFALESAILKTREITRSQHEANRNNQGDDGRMYTVQDSTSPLYQGLQLILFCKEPKTCKTFARHACSGCLAGHVPKWTLRRQENAGSP